MTLGGFLAATYRRYNRRELIGEDPLRFVYRYRGADDREVVALLASSLAFGRVEQIGRSVEGVLERLGRPADAVERTPRRRMRELLEGFRHRFVGSEELADLLEGVRVARLRWGSLNRLFARRCYEPSRRSGTDMAAALSRFVETIGAPRSLPSYLLPPPSRGSACKRLHLFLRWMVREDDVDPGCWSGISPGDLMVPMDTHMLRVATLLGLTRRATADLRTVREVTERFRGIRPDDPVRYDFALTRLSMAGELHRVPLELRRPPGPSPAREARIQ